MNNAQKQQFKYRASYISDRLDQVEEEIKANLATLHSANLSDAEFEVAREALATLSQIIDRAHDQVEIITRL